MVGFDYCGGASCAAEIASVAALASGRWSMPVLEALYFAGAPTRFRALQRQIGAITQKALSRELTQFVHHGIAARHASGRGDRHVVYVLTDRGLALMQLLDRLGQWRKTQLTGLCGGA
ncbi:hypothetical protein AAW51_5172 [Caldimonas brevitalea]|uniref:HTH hxlR-type domain-containing protein n=1 Tax=Caldimonas brevitalea TaxID=413882 RepID=A0A0G3BV29_9BURK|nr:hypothetical protein AAW51_5172 [Caldimonas brevitalea]